MIDLKDFAFAGLVIGIPLIYMIVKTLKNGQSFLPVALIVVILLFLLPPVKISLIWWLCFAIMAIFTGILSIYTLMSICLFFKKNKNNSGEETELSEIAVLIPARNEVNVISGCLDSLTKANFANRLQIIVIDDGSVDGTADLVASYKERYPNIRLMVRGHSAVRGKAAALNDALPEIDCDFFCVLDADHHVSKNFFSATLSHFRDPEIGAVQALKLGRNRFQNLLTNMVELESLGFQYSFLDSKSRAQLVPVLYGSGCVFRTDLIQQLEGFNNDLATEDLEISFRIHEAGYKINFEPGAFTTDELVMNLKALFRQRYRWMRGTAQAIRLHLRSFYQAKQIPLRKKVDFAFYPVLLCLMLSSYLQLSTYAVGRIADIKFPLDYMPFLCFLTVIFAWHLVAGLRNFTDGRKHSIINLITLPFLAAGMIFYYALFMAINLKAFLDEFVLRTQYRSVKAEHFGTEAFPDWQEIPRQTAYQLSTE